MAVFFFFEIMTTSGTVCQQHGLSNKYFLEWLLRIPFGRFASTPEPWQPDEQILDYFLYSPYVPEIIPITTIEKLWATDVWMMAEFATLPTCRPSNSNTTLTMNRIGTDAELVQRGNCIFFWSNSLVFRKLEVPGRTLRSFRQKKIYIADHG